MTAPERPVSDATPEPTLGEIHWDAYIAKMGAAFSLGYFDLDSLTRDATEDGAQAVAAHIANPTVVAAFAEILKLRDRLDGLMPMGVRFDDADPVAVCLVGDCKWHAHGDAMTDATKAWTAHLAEVHRLDWPED